MIFKVCFRDLGSVAGKGTGPPPTSPTKDSWGPIVGLCEAQIRQPHSFRGATYREAPRGAGPH